MTKKPEIRVSGFFVGDVIYIAVSRPLTPRLFGYAELRFTTARKSASRAKKGSMLHMIIKRLFDPENDDLGVTRVVAEQRKMKIDVNEFSDKARVAKMVGDVLRTRYTVVNVHEVTEDDKAEG